MITVCNMTSQHVAQVAALEKLCFADPWSENSVAAELEHDYSLWVVALEEDTVVGYVGAQISFEEADMMNVAVHPDHRRKGIAESVIDALIAQKKAESEREKARVTSVSSGHAYRYITHQRPKP